MGFNLGRAARLIDGAVSSFDLDLEGLTVYTEAATGGFASTAALAVAADAESVYALAADSSHGRAEEARNHTTELTAQVGDEDQLLFPDEKREKDVREADIVTNTGFVRPIDATMVGYLEPPVAIPLMYEPWEFRSSDIDIEAAWNAGIPVLGTDESDDRVATQEYLRCLGPALAFESDIEVFKSNCLVVGGGRMAEHAAAGFASLGAAVDIVAPDTGEVATMGTDRDGHIPPERLDLVLVVDHATDTNLLGDDGVLDGEYLDRLPTGVIVNHVCGPMSTDVLDDKNIKYVPDEPAATGSMSFTTGHLGPRPIIDLHGAGLRVGEDLRRALTEESDLEDVTSKVASTALAADFDESFKKEHGFY